MTQTVVSVRQVTKDVLWGCAVSGHVGELSGYPAAQVSVVT